MNKLTNQDRKDLISFNKRKKQLGEKQLTEQEYLNYLYGKGLPIKKTTLKNTYKLGIPNWANDPKIYPSNFGGNYIATKNTIMERSINEDPKIREEIVRKAKSIAIPYSKGGYQYISNPDEILHLGKKNI